MLVVHALKESGNPFGHRHLELDAVFSSALNLMLAENLVAGLSLITEADSVLTFYVRRDLLAKRAVSDETLRVHNHSHCNDLFKVGIFTTFLALLKFS